MASATKKKPVRKSPPQKGELKTEYLEEIGLFRVKYTGAGMVPVVLSGNYTTQSFAKKAIDTYIALR